MAGHRHVAEAVAQDLADLRKAFIEETSSKAKQLRGLRHGADELKVWRTATRLKLLQYYI